MFRRTLAALGSAATLVWSLPAAAFGDVTIYDNAQSAPIGGRAAGMGGAYTALACDEGALHYNPASLSCAAASHLELTANAYVLQGLRATGALGPGGNVSTTTYHSIPSIVGAVHILTEGSERTYFDTYPGRLTFGFTVSVPRTVALRVPRLLEIAAPTQILKRSAWALWFISKVLAPHLPKAVRRARQRPRRRRRPRRWGP